MPKFLSKLRPSRERILQVFLRRFPMSPEFKVELDEAKVTNHIVLFLMPNMTSLYEKFTGELKTQGHPFEEKTGLLKTKVGKPAMFSILAVIVPKFKVSGNQLHDVAVTVGMLKK